MKNNKLYTPAFKKQVWGRGYCIVLQCAKRSWMHWP